MSVKEIKEGIELGKVFFGIKQVLKNLSGKKKLKNIFVAKDAREETIKKLENAKINFVVLKSKEDIAKELGLDFASEVYSIK